MKRYFWFGILVIVFSLQANADELVYEPVNPAFGGKPQNGSWLLANAQAQDDFDDPDIEDKSSVERFRESLERLIISRLSMSIVDYIDPDSESGLTLGEAVEIGDFTVTITEGTEEGSLEITAIDESTGEITVFEIGPI